MRRWIGVHLDTQGKNLPFSFVYDGRPSAAFLSSWTEKKEIAKLDEHRTRVTTTRTDPATGLEVRYVAVEYSDFPAVEWTVTLKNTGKHDTPIVEDLQALDATIEVAGDPILHHNVGSPANAGDYGPLETPLPAGTSKRLSAAGGRPTNTDMSYFNLAWHGQGEIVVVGWPGQWAATFAHDAGSRVQVVAGQEQTHFTLHPGEEVRTPLIVLLDWKGDWIDGQNQWRRWMMAYGMPHPGGKLPQPMMLASSSRAYQEMIGANEENQIMHIRRYREEGFKLNYWWMDAGWYIQEQGWPQVGTWEPDPQRFPHGFKPISDYAHAHGVKILVWFEPERVAPGTWLAENHEEWLLNPAKSLLVRHSSTLGTNEPLVILNSASWPVTIGTVTWKPHSLSLHPGPKGEYSVVRFTAPKAGTYKIDSTFAEIDQKTTTDVHVLVDGRPISDAYIQLNGLGATSPFSGSVDLAAGDTVDFVVGYGNGHYDYDSTGLDAKITGPDGKAHDAATEFGGELWNYGWLTPGGQPDASTFRVYDLKETGGETGNQLLDLGNPEARKWLTEHIDKLIVDNGIDLYRQDFNIDPLSFWRANEPPDRQGVTENHYVVGYLAYWDELRRRHPDMLIDSCASGGRRNDLETMRRAVPLWRSDYAYEPIGHQSQTYGISMWLPYYGTGTVAVESAPYYGGGVTPVHPYAFWSNAVPALGCGIDIREKGLDYPELLKLFADWRSIAPDFYGDYYPLTPYSLAEDAWIGWQFHRPSSGDGMIEVFRRAKAGVASTVVKLRGLQAAARYRLSVVDGPGVLDGRVVSGRDLMEGLTVDLPSATAALVLRYGRTGD